MNESLESRLEALEVTVETVFRPMADVLSVERIHGIERAGYEAQLRIDALEKRLLEVERTAAEALQISKAMVNSRTWQALVKVSGFLLRLRGHSE